MFRSQYDGDNTTWSPQGRIHQIEYAMEAVKQGSACVGLKSKTHALVAALMRASSELGAHQNKVFKIDEHMGMSIAGLTADGRLLCKYMRNECLNHQFVYEQPIQVGRLVSRIADKSQIHTQQYGRRPYGVGLLVAGYDQTGAHLYETSPSGNYYDYKAMAIGARSQSSKTYLEKHFASFQEQSVDGLIKHALLALREATQTNEPLSTKNCSIGIVGENMPFTIIQGNQLQPYLATLDEEGGQTTTATPMQD